MKGWVFRIKSAAVVLGALTLLIAMGSWAMAADKGSSAGGEPSVEKRVAALEDMVAKLQAQNAQLQAALDSETAARKQGDANTLATADGFCDGSVRTESAARQAADADLQAGLTDETARAKSAEASLASQVGVETWHGHYVQGGSTVQWTAEVHHNGASFTGTTTEVLGGRTYVADISGSWDGTAITFVKTYQSVSAEPITYTGDLGTTGDVQGTWQTSFGSGDWAMSR